jgi:hypothetical protein
VFVIPPAVLLSSKKGVRVSLAELFADDFSTTLASPFAAGDSSIGVQNPAPTVLQGPGQFAALVDGGTSNAEIVLVQNAGSGTTWQVLRGSATGEQPVPVPVAHAVGATVAQVLTQGALVRALANAGNINGGTP